MLRPFLLIAILAVGAAFRIIESATLPIWMDEASSFWFSNLGWKYLWTEVPRFENHPPAYFLLLKAWTALAGSSEFALRFPTVMASLGSVLALFAAGRILGESQAVDNRLREGWIMGLTAAALAAFSQFEITYAAEARPYAFASLGASVMMVGTLRLITGTAREPDGTRSVGGAAALVLGMATSLWAQPLGVVPVGLTGLFLIGWWAIFRRGDGGAFLRLAAMAGLVLLLCWPHFVNLAAQLSRDYSAFWIKAPSIYNLFAITFRAVGLSGLPFGLPVEALATCLVLGAGLMGLLRKGRVNPVAALLPVYLAGGYWAILVVYTYLSQPVLLDRTLIYMHPPMLLIAAAAPWVVERPRPVVATGVAALALLSCLGPNDLHPGGQRLYGVAARQIAEQNPDAPVIAIPGDAEAILDYYETRLDVDFDILPLPGSFPPTKNGLPDMIGKPEITSETISRAVGQVSDAPVVWVVARQREQEVEILRNALRRSGWREVPILEAEPGNETTFLRYERLSEVAISKND